MSLRQGASTRIKIQWIEFLCDKTGDPRLCLTYIKPPFLAKGLWEGRRFVSRILSPQPYGGGLTNRRPSLREGGDKFWVLRRMSHKNSIHWIFMRDLADLAPPVVKTGGAQIREMAEGSQICDFREAKVEAKWRRARKYATFAKRRWMRLVINIQNWRSMYIVITWTVLISVAYNILITFVITYCYKLLL